MVEEQSLGRRLPLAGSCCHPPASLPLVGDGLVCTLLALLWYSLSPLFCGWALQCLRLELFMGKFSLSFSLSLWLSHSLGCYLMLAPSDCPQGIQHSPYPKQHSRHLLVSTRLLVVDQMSGLLLMGFAVRHIICGFLFLFLFFSPPGYVAL